MSLIRRLLLKHTLALFEQAGLRLLDDPFHSRKLIFSSTQKDVQFLVLRATDVPTYVQLGAADLGVVGKDTLMEHGGVDLGELLDLKIGRCTLMTAVVNADASSGAAENSYSSEVTKNIATKYPNIAKAYYQSQGVQAKIIKLYGAMELAPLIGLADEIVDIVETGNTLRANNLIAKEHIADISTRLIVNATSMRVKHNTVSAITSSLRQALEIAQE